MTMEPSVGRGVPDALLRKSGVPRNLTCRFGRDPRERGGNMRAQVTHQKHSRVFEAFLRCGAAP